jgi:hypothetical protein
MSDPSFLIDIPGKIVLAGDLVFSLRVSPDEFYCGMEILKYVLTGIQLYGREPGNLWHERFWVPMQLDRLPKYMKKTNETLVGHVFKYCVSPMGIAKTDTTSDGLGVPLIVDGFVENLQVYY